MRQRLLKFVFCLLGAIIAGIVLIPITTSCSGSPEKQIGKKPDEETLRLREAIAAMTVRHQADTKWHLDLGFLPLSIDLEDRLQISTGRPILIIGELIDIRRSGDGFKILVGFETTSGAKIRFNLDGDKDQAQRIRSILIEKYLWGRNFAIVASISSVRRKAFDLQSNWSGGDSPVELEVVPSDMFFAEGRCIDLIFLGHVLPSDILEKSHRLPSWPRK